MYMWGTNDTYSILGMGDHFTCGGPYVHVGNHMIGVPYKVRGTIRYLFQIRYWGP